MNSSLLGDKDKLLFYVDKKCGHQGPKFGKIDGEHYNLEKIWEILGTIFFW